MFLLSDTIQMGRQRQQQLQRNLSLSNPSRKHTDADGKRLLE